MSPDWDGAARSETTKFIARPIMATADNPTTVRLKLPRDARSQGIGLFACRSPRVSMLSDDGECTCALSGRSDKLALVIVSMTNPPMVNEGNVAAGRLRRCDGRHRFAVLRGLDGSLPLAASRRPDATQRVAAPDDAAWLAEANARATLAEQRLADLKAMLD